MQRVAEAFILPAGPGDAIDLARAQVSAWRETYRGLLPDSYLDAMSIPVHARRWRLQLTRARPGEVALIAEGPGGVIGYCTGSGDEVQMLYLIRSAQKAGLGRRLLSGAARVLQAHGAKSLRLWVLDGNANAKRFYAHLGGLPRHRRRVAGWGGRLSETAYVWDDIAALTQS
jgi:GNAT superfamily N-acetyltransferase